MISFAFLPALLVKSVENRFHSLLAIPQFNPNDSIYILVLGSEYTNNKYIPPNDQLSLISLGRLTEGIRLHRLLNASRVILSISEPELMTALALGVDKNEICLLGTPENTQMEAFDYTKKFGKNNVLILVTDAIHMPRAMFLFEKAGQSPIASPTNHLVKSDWENGVSYWLPASSNIVMMEYAMHEIGGLVYVRLFYRGVADVNKEIK